MTEYELCQVRGLCSNHYPFDTFYHVLRVEKIVCCDARYALMLPEEQRIVTAIALMHDLLEDTLCTEHQIVSLISDPKDALVVVKAIRFLTRKSNETYIEYIRHIASSGSVYAVMVKQADIVDHLREKETLTSSLEKRYKKASRILLFG